MSEPLSTTRLGPESMKIQKKKVFCKECWSIVARIFLAITSCWCAKKKIIVALIKRAFVTNFWNFCHCFQLFKEKAMISPSLSFPFLVLDPYFVIFSWIKLWSIVTNLKMLDLNGVDFRVCDFSILDLFSVYPIIFYFFAWIHA